MRCDRRFVIVGVLELVGLFLVTGMLILLFDPNIVYEPYAKADYTSNMCTVTAVRHIHADAACQIVSVMVDSDKHSLCGVILSKDVNDFVLDEDLDWAMADARNQTSNETASIRTPCFLPPFVSECTTTKVDSSCECCAIKMVVIAKNIDILADSLAHRRWLRRELGCANGLVTLFFILVFFLLGLVIFSLLWRLFSCNRSYLIRRGRRNNKNFIPLTNDGTENTYDDETA